MAIDFFNTYPQNTGAKSEDYPFGSFRNETAPNAEDGTTLEQKWSNDWLAFFSRLLVEAAMTPSGEVDTVKVSQYYDALLALIHRERREVSNALDGTRTEVAASENALRLAYELASAAVKKAGDTMTGDLILQNKLSLRSVGVPANNVGSLFKFENESGTLTIRRGRADGSTNGETRVVMPNKAGTVALEQDMFGVGQTWVDVTSQRSSNTNYQNNTGKMINVSVVITDGVIGDPSVIMYVDGIVVNRLFDINELSHQFTLLVPAGSTYKINAGSNPINQWSELR